MKQQLGFGSLEMKYVAAEGQLIRVAGHEFTERAAAFAIFKQKFLIKFRKNTCTLIEKQTWAQRLAFLNLFENSACFADTESDQKTVTPRN